MQKMELRNRINDAIAQQLEKFGALSDRFAAEPETGSQEFKSSEALVAVLREAGFQVQYPYGGVPTAFNAVFKKGDGPVVVLLAEYDALPEIGHACGHNVSGVMSALAGVALKEALSDIAGEVRVVGTPAEETNGAKVTFAEQGFFDDADIAMMIHLTTGENRIGYRSLALQALEFTFTGKPAHAASCPWEGVNALNGAQLFFHSIDMLRQHVRPEVRMHGVLIEGGNVANVVPEKTVARFYFRAPWKKYLGEMMKQVFNCARGSALATGTEVTWRNNEFSFDELLANPTGELAMLNIFKELGLSSVEREAADGSSDVGNVSWCCPTLQPQMSISSEVVPLHTREFATLVSGGKPVRRVLSDGARALAWMGLDILTDSKLRKDVRDAFEQERQKLPQ